MNLSYMLYNLVVRAGTCVLPAFFLASVLSPRLAFHLPKISPQGHLPFQNNTHLWLHAVSVGEVGIAQILTQKILASDPDCQITISSTSRQGLNDAKEKLGLQTQVIPFPLDLPWAVKGAVQRIRPKIYASLETEIWPNLIEQLYGVGAKILLLNGRISPRSFPTYQKIKPLLSHCLSRFSAFSMISDQDAERIVALGADPAKVSVSGNVKYANLLDRTSSVNLDPIKAKLALQQQKLLVAGSVRTGEEKPVIASFLKVQASYPDTVFLIAPRHIKRAGQWHKACVEQGLTVMRWSETNIRPQSAQVVILDEMGLLFSVYALAQAAFVGASLVELGGQNPLEPAAWGTPVAFGPDMADFQDVADDLLVSQAGFRVKNEEELADFWLNSLHNKFNANLGKQVTARWARGAQKAAELVMSFKEN